MALLLLVSLAFGGILVGCKTSSDENNNNGGQTQTQVLENISATEAYNLIQNNAVNLNFIIIDVRTADEYNAERIEGAININSSASDFSSQLDMLDKDKIYLLYCRSGNRSGNAQDTMEGLGFTEVYNMSGGINAWKASGYPTVD
jgi:rhodanese-related sulfurtransferase